MLFRRLIAAAATAASVTAASVCPAAAQARFIRDADAVTDENRSRVVIPSADAQALGGTLVAGANAVVRCDGDSSFDIFIVTHEFLDNEGTIRSIWRFDREEPEELSLNVSTTGTGGFLRVRKLQITRRLQTAGMLYVRMFDYRGTPHTFRFPLAGSMAAINRLACVERYAHAKEERRGAAEAARRAELEANPWRQFGSMRLLTVATTRDSVAGLVRDAAVKAGWQDISMDQDSEGFDVKLSESLAMFARRGADEWQVRMAGDSDKEVERLQREFLTLLHGPEYFGAEFVLHGLSKSHGMEITRAAADSLGWKSFPIGDKVLLRNETNNLIEVFLSERPEGVLVKIDSRHAGELRKAIQALVP